MVRATPRTFCRRPSQCYVESLAWLIWAHLHSRHRENVARQALLLKSFTPYKGERVRRIELPYQAWEACVLPLNYTRVALFSRAKQAASLVPRGDVVIHRVQILVRTPTVNEDRLLDPARTAKFGPIDRGNRQFLVIVRIHVNLIRLAPRIIEPPGLGMVAGEIGRFRHLGSFEKSDVPAIQVLSLRRVVGHDHVHDGTGTV